MGTRRQGTTWTTCASHPFRYFVCNDNLILLFMGMGPGRRPTGRPAFNWPSHVAACGECRSLGHDRK
eukprot:5782235-Prymnesium_polylepis.1